MIQKVFHDIRAFEALFLQPYNGTAMFGIQELVSILSLVDQGMVLEPFLVKLESWMAGPLSKFSDILFKFVDLMAECSWPMHQFILRRVMHFAQSNAQLSVPFVRILHTLCSVEPYDKTRSSPVFLVFLERSAANSPADTRICLESFLKDIYMCNVQTREPSGTAGQVIRQQRGALNKKLQSFIRLCLDAPDNHGSLFAVLMQDSTAFLDLLLCLTAEKNTPVPLIYELIQLISKNGDSDWIFSRHLRVWESHLPGMVERLGHPLPALAKGARDILTSLIVHGQTNKRLSRAILDHVLNWLESQTSAQFSTYLVNSLLSLLDSLLDLPDTNFMLVVHFRAQKWLEENGSGLRIMVGVITLVSVAKKCPCDHSLLEICLTDLDANETSRIECQLSLMEICLEKGFHAGLLLSKTSDLIDLLTSLPLVPRVLAILGRIMTHLASLDARSENHLVEEGEVIRDEFAWVDWALSMSSMLLQRFSWTARGYRSFVLESISQHLAKTWKKLPESHKREIWKGAKSAMQ